MVPRRRVLVIDPSEETHTVLTAALSRRGVELLAAREAGEGALLARDTAPDVIVVDLDAVAQQNSPGSLQLSEATCLRAGSVIVLGTTSRGERPLEGGAYMSKPYHYGPLIRKIESILEQTRSPAERAA